MADIREKDLHREVFIIVGVGPLRSAKSAVWMQENVPGVYIPEPLLDRLSKTPKSKQSEEGMKICVELIHQIREIEGVAGVHVMAYRQEDKIAEIIQSSGLFPR